ncbi:hypothetical protein C8Q80DRAFT_1124628 [Daedaleopsis nitida]|nr:hypothetical protein C8Q80DRAFT_1124628 [Daedaleopsis nitida]
MAAPTPDPSRLPTYRSSYTRRFHPYALYLRDLRTSLMTATRQQSDGVEDLTTFNVENAAPGNQSQVQESKSSSNSTVGFLYSSCVWPDGRHSIIPPSRYTHRISLGPCPCWTSTWNCPAALPNHHLLGSSDMDDTSYDSSRPYSSRPFLGKRPKVDTGLKPQRTPTAPLPLHVFEYQ